jgi:uncharacterized membrane protein YccC
VCLKRSDVVLGLICMSAGVFAFVYGALVQHVQWVAIAVGVFALFGGTAIFLMSKDGEDAL